MISDESFALLLDAPHTSQTMREQNRVEKNERQNNVEQTKKEGQTSESHLKRPVQVKHTHKKTDTSKHPCAMSVTRSVMTT